MKDAREDTVLSVVDANEDILTDDTDAAMSWIPVALKLAQSNTDMEV